MISGDAAADVDGRLEGVGVRCGVVERRRMGGGDRGSSGEKRSTSRRARLLRRPARPGLLAGRTAAASLAGVGVALGSQDSVTGCSAAGAGGGAGSCPGRRRADRRMVVAAAVFVPLLLRPSQWSAHCRIREIKIKLENEHKTGKGTNGHKLQQFAT